jgi:hypothetical protein
MRHALPATGCVIALVVLAGCGGMLGGGTPTPETAPSTAVPTDGPLDTPPTGLEESGITDPTDLAGTHDAALADTGFTYRTTETLTAANGTELVDSTLLAQYPANESRALVDRTYGTPAPMLDGETGTVTQWYNGSAALLRITTAEGTEYGVIPGTGVGDPSVGDRLEPYYSAANEVAVTSNGSHVELRLTSTSGEEVPGRLPVDVTNRTVTVTMTGDGQVEQYRVEYTGTLVTDPGTTVEGVRTVAVTDVGTTAPAPPDWLPDARDATNTSGR